MKIKKSVLKKYRLFTLSRENDFGMAVGNDPHFTIAHV